MPMRARLCALGDALGSQNIDEEGCSLPQEPLTGIHWVFPPAAAGWHCS